MGRKLQSEMWLFDESAKLKCYAHFVRGHEGEGPRESK